MSRPTRCWAAISLAPKPGDDPAFAIPIRAWGATKAQFDAAIAVHPTLAEELVTMRKPSRRVGGNDNVGKDLDKTSLSASDFWRMPPVSDNE